jgi:hypothetical protein
MADLLNATELSQKVNEKLEELKKQEEETATEDKAEVVEENKPSETVEETDSSTNKEEEKNVSENSDDNKETASSKQESSRSEESSEEDSNEKSEEELKQFATENNIPKSISLNVVKDWDKIPDEARKAMLKLANDADRFANTVKENQRAVSERNKELGTAIGYIKHTAKTANISENQVIKNVVDWVQAVEDNPDATMNAYIGNVIKVRDPITLINTIMQRYNITEEQLKTPLSFNDRQKIDYQIQENVRQKQADRAKQYEEATQEEQTMAEINTAMEEFGLTHDQSLFNDEKFIKIVQLERTNNQNKPALQVLEDSYAFFQQLQQPKATPVQQSVVAKPQPVSIEKKMQAASLKGTPNAGSETEKAVDYNPSNINQTIADLKRRVAHRLND